MFLKLIFKTEFLTYTCNFRCFQSRICRCINWNCIAILKIIMHNVGNSTHIFQGSQYGTMIHLLSCYHNNKITKTKQKHLYVLWYVLYIINTNWGGNLHGPRMIRHVHCHSHKSLRQLKEGRCCSVSPMKSDGTKQWPLLLTGFNFNPSMVK